MILQLIVLMTVNTGVPIMLKKLLVMTDFLLTYYYGEIFLIHCESEISLTLLPDCLQVYDVTSFKLGKGGFFIDKL